MADLSLLNRTFEVSENPGIDTLDPKFQEFVTIVQNEDFAQVLTQAEEIFNENIYDIRIIGYYMFAVFNAQGLPILGEIFATLAGVFRDNWEAVGPAKKKEKQAKTICNWALSRIEKALEYHEEKADEKWESWQQQVTSEDVEGMLENLTAFRKFLMMTLEEDANVDDLSKIERRLQEFQKLVYREPEPEPEPEPEEEYISATDPDAGKTRSSGESMVESSPHMQQLMKKIQAFDILIKKQEHAKAALVADEVNHIIENFDPTIYFPNVFSKYLSMLSVNIEDISGYWEAKDSLSWKTMEKLYQSDLDAFINL